MPINANAGPSLQFGITMSSTGQTTQYNEDRGPSLDDLGAGLMDPRPFYHYQPGAAVNPNSSANVGIASYQTVMFWDNYAYIDYIPTALSTSGIVLNTASSGQTSLTITATGAGVIATQITAPELGTAVSVFALDSTAAVVNFGQSQAVCAWNPAAGTGRTITINPSSNLDGGFYTIAGRDMYGFKMTESIAAGSTNLKGNKAFKYISAISNCSSPTSTGIIVGYGDTYGFPIKLSYVGQNSLVSFSSNAFSYNNNAVILSSATIALASTVAIQGSTSPDVRGTFTSSFSGLSNGTTRLQMSQYFLPSQLSAITAADQSAMFGAVQFSSV